MKKHLIQLSVIILGALSLSSCLGDNDENEQTNTYPYGNGSCFNVVTDNDGTVYIGRNPSYTFSYRMYAGEVDVTINNLQLSPELNGISLQLPPMKFAQNKTDYFVDASGRDLFPVSQGANSPYVFNSFSSSTFPGESVYRINYKLTNSYTNKSYTVKVYSTKFKYYGDVTFIGSEGTPYINEANTDSYMTVAINPETLTATLSMNNGKFADGKNTSFAIKGIPVTLTAIGYEMSSTPGQSLQLQTIGLTGDKKDCFISDIKATASLASGASISFKLDLGTDGKYDVSAPGQRYLVYTKTND